MKIWQQTLARRRGLEALGHPGFHSTNLINLLALITVGGIASTVVPSGGYVQQSKEKVIPQCRIWTILDF